jgi:hypothetical protein
MVMVASTISMAMEMNTVPAMRRKRCRVQVSTGS